MRVSCLTLLAALTACAASPRGPVSEPAVSEPAVSDPTPDAPGEPLRPGSTTVASEDRIVFVDSATLSTESPNALLDRLEAIGASTLYLFGISLTPSGNLDPAAVRDELGGDEGLVHLTRQARRRGFDVIVDLELNHVDARSPLVERRPDWFHRYGAIRDYDDPRQLLFFDIEGTRDFAQEKPEVAAFLIGAATSFLDRAPISGLGFQSARHVPIPFWAELVWASSDAAETHFRTIATWLSGNPRMLALVLEEVGFSEVLDVPTHFALYETVCDRAAPERLASILYADRRYEEPSRLVTWLDHPGIPSAEDRCGADERAIRSVLTLQHGLRGRPAITRRLARCANGDDECSHGRTAHLRALYELRKAHPVLYDGETRLIAAGTAGLLLLRIGQREVAAVLYNASEREPLKVPVPMGVSAKAMIHAYGVEVQGGQLIAEPGHSGIAVFRRPGTGALDWSSPSPRDVEVVVEGVPENASEVVLVGDHEVFGNWERARGLRLRREGQAYRGETVLPRGAAAELRVVAMIDGEEILEEGPRFLFVGHQRGAHSLRWRWRQ